MRDDAGFKYYSESSTASTSKWEASYGFPIATLFLYLSSKEVTALMENLL